MTTQSKEVSAMAWTLVVLALRRPAGHLDSSHRAHELPEQPAAEAGDAETERDGGHVRGDRERQRGDEDGHAEQRLEAEDGPVARPPHAPGGGEHQRGEED